MQIASASSVASMASLSVLKSANEQPTLAGELISKTIEGLMQAQLAQTPVQTVELSAVTGIGRIVNTTA
jgi:hypothetical protein